MSACGQSEYVKMKIAMLGSRMKGPPPPQPQYGELLYCLCNLMGMILVSLILQSQRAKLAFRFLHLQQKDRL